MEVKINRDIKEYKENIFFGLSLRQCIFAICSCISAIILYFALRDKLNTETLSWVCILGTLPFAILGFVKYNGMNAERFVITWIRNELLMPSYLLFKPVNYYSSLISKEKPKKVKDKYKAKKLNIEIQKNDLSITKEEIKRIREEIIEDKKQNIKQNKKKERRKR